MTLTSLQTWLNAYQLTPEQAVLANLALALAARFDEKPDTSTAAELRKTCLELSRALRANEVELDPLDDLLKR